MASPLPLPLPLLDEREREENQKRGMVNDGRTARTKKESFHPREIIIEILSRISGSSVVSFRPVCKYWNSLTRDNELIDLHLKRASVVSPPLIIIFSQDEEKDHHKYHLTLLDEKWHPKYMLTKSSNPILTTTPCNGLICLYDFERNIKLCNPTTHEILSLPKPTIDCRGVVNGFPKCSFGFDPSTNKYKVVRFFYRLLHHSTESYDLGCEIFTLGTDSWRHIGNVNYYVTGMGINVNGSIYWTTGATAKIPEVIVALDLKDEKFRTVFTPDVASYGIVAKHDMFLVQLEGNLCLVNSNYGVSGSMDILMLKDCTNSVWVHRYSFCLQLGDHCRSRPEPIFVYDGKILLRLGGNLYYHDLHRKNGLLEKVYEGKFLGSTAKFYTFVESLLPLRI